MSLASAAALYRRVGTQLPGGWTPSSVRIVGESGLRAHGLTRQKARYVAELALRVDDGTLSLAALARASDDSVLSALVTLPGVGVWTASIYLLMALGRPDVWPSGDLALHKALAKFRGSSRLPSTEQATRFAARWAPYRAVAARILWQSYLASSARGSHDVTS